LDTAYWCSTPTRQPRGRRVSRAPAIAPYLDDPALALLPGILKTARLGYDGKGQVHAWPTPPRWRPPGSAGACPACWSSGCRCARAQRHRRARRDGGAVVHLPVQQNLHRDGILAVTQVPAPDVDEATAREAVALARRLAERMDYVGVLCVEFFVLADGSLVANEMAPRPHNSGHYSIDACDVSQFDLQVRTLAGLPLVRRGCTRRR
jgi:5-(carboxyamino)imidazole ribonucleotide synthase